jgi:hypothetical protein
MWLTVIVFFLIYFLLALILFFCRPAVASRDDHFIWPFAADIRACPAWCDGWTLVQVGQKRNVALRVALAVLSPQDLKRMCNAQYYAEGQQHGFCEAFAIFFRQWQETVLPKQLLASFGEDVDQVLSEALTRALPELLKTCVDTSVRTVHTRAYVLASDASVVLETKD